MTALAPDTHLADRYVLIEPARDRGLGESWRARDLQRPDATVLIKRLSAVGDVPPEALRALRSLRALRHPTIPAVLSHGVHEGGAWVATEDVAGDSIGTFLDRARASGALIPLSILRAVFTEVVDALGAAHGNAPPLLHLGLSPGSVIRFASPARAGTCALLDLGIAPWLGPSLDAPPRSARNLIARPPELFRHAPATPVTDVFLLAALLTEMLALPAPPGETLAAVGYARRRDDVPGPVWEVLARAMSVSPASRHPSVRELAAAVDAAWAAPLTAVPTGARAYPDSLLESIVVEEGRGPSIESPALQRWKLAPAEAAPAAAAPIYGAMPALPEAPEPPTTFENPWASGVLDRVVDAPSSLSARPAPPTSPPAARRRMATAKLDERSWVAASDNEATLIEESAGGGILPPPSRGPSRDETLVAATPIERPPPHVAPALPRFHLAAATTPLPPARGPSRVVVWSLLLVGLVVVAGAFAAIHFLF